MGERARLASVDALRGVTVAAMLLVNTPGDWGHVFALLKHADWHGCTPTDLVFPSFLFVAGVSITLGIERLTDRTVLLRALRIIGLGLALHAVAHWVMDTPSFRVFGVLQRIGLCFAAAGLVAIHARPRTQWLVFAAILLGYWALMAWAGPLSKEGNLASRLDTVLLGRFAYEFDPATGLGHEPEGVLTTLPAIATTILGVRAGEWLRRRQWRCLLWAGFAALVAGAVWSLVFPLNKQLWTSSFVLWTGGWALLALALLEFAIDRHHAPALGRRFGVNAIAAYAGAWLLEVLIEGLHWKAALYRHGFGWMAPAAGAYVTSLAYAVAFVAFWWIVVTVMDRRGVYLKI